MYQMFTYVKIISTMPAASIVLHYKLPVVLNNAKRYLASGNRFLCCLQKHTTYKLNSATHALRINQYVLFYFWNPSILPTLPYLSCSWFGILKSTLNITSNKIVIQDLFCSVVYLRVTYILSFSPKAVYCFEITSYNLLLSLEYETIK